MSAWQPIDLGDPNLNREINRLTASLDESPARWWWLSFCDATRPKVTQFLGGALIHAPNEIMALERAWELGVNPGGEVGFAGPIPEDAIPEGLPREVLMSKETIAEFDA